jgi:hypothetical protein
MLFYFCHARPKQLHNHGGLVDGGGVCCCFLYNFISMLNYYVGGVLYLDRQLFRTQTYILAVIVAMDLFT